MKKAGYIPAKGGKPSISFKPGGLHRSTGTPAGKLIPAAKKEEAREGKLGPKAKKQEEFAENVLVGRRGK